MTRFASARRTAPDRFAALLVVLAFVLLAVAAPAHAVPAKVTGVTVTVASTTSLRVSWDALSDACSYFVQWKWKLSTGKYSTERQATVGSDPCNTPGIGIPTSYVITALTAGTTYTVRVTALDADDNDGPPSDDVTGTPRPLQPTGVSVEIGEVDGTLEVSWTVPEGAHSMQVQWKGAGQDYDASRTASGIAGTAYDITGLLQTHTYTVRVRGLTGTGVAGFWSAEETEETEGVALTVVGSSDTRVFLALVDHTGAWWTSTPSN